MTDRYQAREIFPGRWIIRDDSTSRAVTRADGFPVVWWNRDQMLEELARLNEQVRDEQAEDEN